MCTFFWTTYIPWLLQEVCWHTREVPIDSMCTLISSGSGSKHFGTVWVPLDGGRRNTAREEAMEPLSSQWFVWWFPSSVHHLRGQEKKMMTHTTSATCGKGKLNLQVLSCYCCFFLVSVETEPSARSTRGTELHPQSLTRQGFCHCATHPACHYFTREDKQLPSVWACTISSSQLGCGVTGSTGTCKPGKDSLPPDNSSKARVYPQYCTHEKLKFRVCGGVVLMVSWSPGWPGPWWVVTFPGRWFWTAWES